MAETHEHAAAVPDAGHEHEHGPNLRVYMTIALALAVFTAASFVVNFLVRPADRGGIELLSPTVGFMLILAVAIVKATLVGMFFMHLMYDWNRLYFLIVPAFILGAMMMMVLLPDILLAWL